MNAAKSSKRILIPFLILLLHTVLSAQDSPVLPESRPALKLYLDCSSCDISYLTENLDVVSFVTEPSTADIHLIVTNLANASGSTAISMIFNGKQRFASFRDTLTFQLSPNLTLEDKRSIMLEKIQLGLVPFLMKTQAASRLMLFVGESYLPEEHAEKDPWRDWVFELNGMGSVYSQKNYNSYNLNLGLNITRVNEKFKLESYSHFDYNESQISYSYFDVEKMADTIIHYNTCQRGFSSSNLAVGSLGKHFGVGGMLILRNDHPNNLNFRVQAGPAVEFNVYPYKDALQKQFRFMYSLLYEQTQYVEPTIFDKMRDEGWKQNLRVIARFSNTWGYLDASLSGSSYFEDMSRYSVGVSSFADIRIYKGFSVNFQAGLYMYRDRINQPKGYATFDEILTRQKEMSTDYQYNFSFGITYRFGSKKFPPMNPRFSY